MSRTTAIAGAAALALLCAAAAASAGTQWPRRLAQPDGYYDSDVQVASSRAARQLVENAAEDLEAGEYERCVRQIQEVLDAHASGSLASEAGRFVGTWTFCNEFIAKLPAAGGEAYLRIFDPYAEELFERGLTRQDVDLLVECYRRYRNTTHGLPALLASIDLAFEKGDFHRAVELTLLHAEQHPEDVETRARGLAVIAISARMLEDPGLLEAALAGAPDELLELPVRLGGVERRVGDVVAESRESLPERPGRRAPPVQSFLRPAWAAKIGMQSWGTRSETWLDDFGRQADRDEFCWNPMLPEIDQGTVYVSNGVSVRALGLFGEAVRWSYEGPVRTSQARVDVSSEFPLLLDGGLLFAALETSVEQETRIWNYTPQMAVPHRRLHAIDVARGTAAWTHEDYRHAEATAEERFFVRELSINSRPLVVGDRLFVSAVRFHTGYQHYVCCFDRATGRLHWSTFVCTGQMEQNMFGNRVRECFAGNLVEHRGVLYYSTNIGIVAAVDARLGTLRHTAAYTQVPIPRQDRSYRQIFERAPTWANNDPVVVGDDVWFTPRDSQDLVVLDTSSGVLRTVLSRDEQSRYRYMVGPHEGRIVLLGAHVAFIDARAKRVLADRIDVGRADGANRGRAARGLGVIARPLLVEDTLYAPAKVPGRRGPDEKLYVWDLKTLKLLHELDLDLMRSEGPKAGNLAANRDAVVMAATDPSFVMSHVRSFFDRGAIQARLEREIAEDPADPAPHYQAGELALQGDRTEVSAALSRFRRALELGLARGPSARVWVDKSRDALHRLYVELAEGPEEGRAGVGLDAEGCYEAALEVARSEAQQLDILFRLLARAGAARDWTRFERNYSRLMRDHAATAWDHRDQFQVELPELATFQRIDRAGLVATLLAGRLATRLERDRDAVALYQTIIREYPELTVGAETAWTYARERIDALIARRGREVYAEQERRATQLFEEARGAADETALRRLLDLYPNSELSARTYVELARRQIAAGDRTMAVNTIQESLSRFDRFEGDALVNLARAWEGLGLERSAAQAWAYARAVTPRDTVEDGESLRSVAELADLALEGRRPQGGERERALPSLGLSASEAWTSGSPDDANDWVIVEPRGTVPEDLRDHFLAFKGGSLSLFGKDRPEPRWTRFCESAPLDRCHWFDGRLVMLLDNEIVVADPRSGDEIWRRGVPERQITGLAVGQGKVYALVQLHSFSRNFRLQARSLLDGAVVFEKAWEGTPYREISVSDRWIAVSLESSPVTHVIDAFTGRPAEGMPEGFAYDDVKVPSLSSTGLLVVVSSAGEERVLAGIDPVTGARRWSRKLGASEFKTWFEDATSIVYHLHRSEAEETGLYVVDADSGVSLLERRLPGETFPAHGLAIDGTGLHAVMRETVTRPRRRILFHVESLEFGTGASRFRTASFDQAHLRVVPFREGLLVRAIERVFVSGKRTASYVATLHLVDRAGGRVETSLEMASRNPRYFQSMVTVVDGALVAADGPVLKVYKP